MDLSTTVYQPIDSTTSESVFNVDEYSAEHTKSYINVDQDSAMTEVSHSDRDEEQIIILNRSNNHFK